MPDSNESAETTTDTGVQGGTESQQQGESQQQADKDWKAEADKWRELARKHEKDSKARAGAAEKLAALEESQKTEAQKVADRAAVAETRAQQAERDLMRYRVAADKKVPAEWVDRLRGDTEEEIAADADLLMKSLKPANDLRPDHSQGSRTSGEPAMNMNTLLRQAAGRG